MLMAGVFAGQYFINFTGADPNETEEAEQKQYLIRNLTMEERAVRSCSHYALNTVSDALRPLVAYSGHSWWGNNCATQDITLACY